MRDIAGWRDMTVESAKKNVAAAGHIHEFAMVLTDRRYLDSVRELRVVVVQEPEDPKETTLVVMVDLDQTPGNLTGILGLILQPEQAATFKAAKEELAAKGADPRHLGPRFAEQMRWTPKQVAAKGLGFIVDRMKALAYMHVCTSFLRPDLTLGPTTREEAVEAVSVYLESPGFRQLVMVPFTRTPGGLEFKEKIDFGKVGGGAFTGLLDKPFSRTAMN